MRVLVRVLFGLALPMVALVSPAAGGRLAVGAVCAVDDPTTSNLNLRSSPRGTLLSSIPNGQTVEIQELQNDNRGLPWARLNDPAGWVYANFLDCTSPVERQSASKSSNFDPVMELNRTRCTMPLLLASRTYPEFCRRQDGYDVVCIQDSGNQDFLGGIIGADQCIRECASADGNCGMSNIDIVGNGMSAEDSYVEQRPWYQEFSFSGRGIRFFCKSSINRIAPADFYAVATLIACQAVRE